jgi:hypothetical protein
VWDLESNEIFFGLQPNLKRYKVNQHSEVNISYGERANSFLLVEYGFAIPDNKYDYFRVSDIGVDKFFTKEHP